MKNQSMASSEILDEWSRMKAQLEEIFRSRDQTNAKLQMEKGISLFLQFLYLVNDTSVPAGQAIPYNQLEIKPVNLEERLGFIISRPSLYHSYRQLSELMIELQKLYVKKQIIKKSSSLKS
ncbi:YpoC family protein [Neobacillus kokaensis]|uniref:YpoC-like domain-containing protein n=1 Tax=Neobacillus kokaensis TaxID=2759023 RepID=A0ABQ3N2K0_9BACI|nr:hypothetical protein [Neobacillus kokaensis]GHH98218.1 hypothetical protein AM1BK_17610 [Neobacillus kokaensis]